MEDRGEEGWGKEERDGRDGQERAGTYYIYILYM